MTKNQILAAFVGTLCLGFTACGNKGGFKKTSDGLEYKIVKDEKGDKHPALGDMVKIHINVHIGDSVLVNSMTMNNGQPFEFPLVEGNFKSDWIGGLPLLTEGDSAVFLVPVDTARKYAQGQFPAFAKDGDKITYEVVLVSFSSSAQQKNDDDQKIQKYLQDSSINAQKTSSGLYYSIVQEGNGPAVTQGSKVTVNYTGKSITGTTFDSNVDPQFNHVEPFSFVAGGGQVIKGWDEGILLLKKGAKAKLIIPSGLAYGPQDMGPGVGKNAILVFDVEVTNVEEAPAQQQMIQ